MKKYLNIFVFVSATLISCCRAQAFVEVKDSIKFYNKTDGEEIDGLDGLYLQSASRLQDRGVFEDNYTLAANDTDDGSFKNIKLCYVQGQDGENYQRFLDECRDREELQGANVTWILASSVGQQQDQNIDVLKNASKDDSIDGLIMMSSGTGLYPDDPEDQRFKKPHLVAVAPASEDSPLKDFAYNLLALEKETEGEDENGADDGSADIPIDSMPDSDPNGNNYNPFSPNFSPDVKPITEGDGDYHRLPPTQLYILNQSEIQVK